MNWRDSKSAGFLRLCVAALKAELEVCYRVGADDAADAIHDDLIACEWRLRRVEKRT